MTDEQLSQLGEIVEKAENLLGAAKLPLPAQIHIDGLTHGLESCRDIAKKLYVELSGDDPWSY
jgi:hypothetical protein